VLWVWYSEGKGKGKIHPRTDHEGPEGDKRYSSVLSSTSVLDGVGGQRHAPAAFPLGKTRYPLYPLYTHTHTHTHTVWIWLMHVRCNVRIKTKGLNRWLADLLYVAVTVCDVGSVYCITDSSLELPSVAVGPLEDLLNTARESNHFQKSNKIIFLCKILILY